VQRRTDCLMRPARPRLTNNFINERSTMCGEGNQINRFEIAGGLEKADEVTCFVNLSSRKQSVNPRAIHFRSIK
jgi:hypothetical protein